MSQYSYFTTTDVHLSQYQKVIITIHIILSLQLPILSHIQELLYMYGDVCYVCTYIHTYVHTFINNHKCNIFIELNIMVFQNFSLLQSSSMYTYVTTQLRCINYVYIHIYKYVCMHTYAQILTCIVQLVYITTYILLASIRVYHQMRIEK